MRLRFTGNRAPMSPPRERCKLKGENILPEDVHFMLRTDAIVQTENGDVGLRTHLREQARLWRPYDDLVRHLIVYQCIGCGRATCACNGSDDDVRCDNCVVRERAAG